MPQGRKRLPEKQGTYKVGHKRPPLHTRFKPGVSGNPGGVKKGTVFVSEAYKRILALPVEDFLEYEPTCIAEQIALEQVQRARGDRLLEDPLPAAKEITDRTEGKAPQNMNLTALPLDDQARVEAAIVYVMQRANCNREVAIEALAAQMPEISEYPKVGVI